MTNDHLTIPRKIPGQKSTHTIPSHREISSDFIREDFGTTTPPSPTIQNLNTHLREIAHHTFRHTSHQHLDTLSYKVTSTQPPKYPIDRNTMFTYTQRCKFTQRTKVNINTTVQTTIYARSFYMAMSRLPINPKTHFVAMQKKKTLSPKISAAISIHIVLHCLSG